MELLRVRKEILHIYLTDYERAILLYSLVELKNNLLRRGRDAYCVDEIVIRVMSAPIKRLDAV